MIKVLFLYVIFLSSFIHNRPLEIEKTERENEISGKQRNFGLSGYLFINPKKIMLTQG